MSTVCLVIAIVLFVLVGFKVSPASLSDFDLLGFGLTFFALAHLPLGDWIKR